MFEKKWKIYQKKKRYNISINLGYSVNTINIRFLRIEFNMSSNSCNIKKRSKKYRKDIYKKEIYKIIVH